MASIAPTKYAIAIRQMATSQFIAELRSSSGVTIATAIAGTEPEAVRSAVEQAFPEGERE